jgi:hypothetical protein
MPLAAILNLSLVAAVVAFNLSTAWLVACAPCCTCLSLLTALRLSTLMATLAYNRHSRPTVFVSFYAPALRFAAQNMLTTAAVLPWSLLD